VVDVSRPSGETEIIHKTEVRGPRCL